MLLNKYLILILVLAFMCSSCSAPNYEKTEEYFYKMNSRIKDMEFYKAEMEGNEILLYDAQNKLITTIPFEKSTHDVDFIYAYKDGTTIRFVTGGSVDDEEGIMFVNDNSDDILEGIHSLERVGGNSYRYSTYGKVK